MGLLFAGDYSINSPGITIQLNDKYHFFNFFNSTKTVDEIIKGKSFDGKLFKELIELDDLTLISYTRTVNSKQEYSDSECSKLYDALALVELISSNVSKFSTEIDHAAFEGYSYGSKGNSALDLAAGAALLRMDLFMQTNGNIKIFSPKQVKKLSGNGNANKLDMYEAFIDNKLGDESLKNSQFWNWVVNNQDLVIKQTKKSKEINKPLDDIIDSYFILQKLKDVIK